MAGTQQLSFTVSYSGDHGNASWQGRQVASVEGFRQYLNARVRTRLDDHESKDPFEAELRGMATTGMETIFVERLLNAVPAEPSWAIGEALAECVLADDESLGVCWPWNTVRDRRTPRASLPGADLVGFSRQMGDVFLLFGEVKTSSDSRVPPNVMYGSGGMAWQLEAEATRLDLQCTLLKWLRSRCSGDDAELYRSAVQRYLKSEGQDILLVGVLLRDTQSDENDVKSRSIALAGKLMSPTRIQITAWYLPNSIPDWPQLLEDAS